MAPIYGLSEADVSALKELLATVRGQRFNTQNRPHPRLPVDPSPPTYIAQAPADGVPALVSSSGGVSAGSADCLIYQNVSVNGVLTLQSLGVTETVYNFSTSPIGANDWFAITRDKFGLWIAVAAGGAGSLGDVWYFDSLAAYCPASSSNTSSSGGPSSGGVSSGGGL